MIKRVKQTKVASIVVFLCAFIIVAYIYTNLNVIWKPKRVQFYDFPNNYVYKEKKVHKERRIPGLRLTHLPSIQLNQSQSYKELEDNFFKFLEQKDVICDDDSRYGNQHDGGWNVCMSPPYTLKKPCLVYSFGIGEDWRFEDDVHDRHGCRVLAFDPSIRLIEHNRTDKIWFKPLGLGPGNKVTKDKWTLKTLKKHLTDEGHLETTIDYLKFDIEFMEWSTLLNMMKEETLAHVKQLAFEIHLQSPIKPNKNDFTLSRHDLVRNYQLLQLLEDGRFMKFNYRMNPFCVYKSVKTSKSRSYCYELHYLNFRYMKSRYLKPS